MKNVMAGEWTKHKHHSNKNKLFPCAILHLVHCVIHSFDCFWLLSSFTVASLRKTIAAWLLSGCFVTHMTTNLTTYITTDMTTEMMTDITMNMTTDTTTIMTMDINLLWFHLHEN